MDRNQVFLSIVTPTYNRGELLKNCFVSLLAQTDKNFEWIIVDDGSTDDTQTIVSGFTPADFPIVYIKKENGGKHTALNASHPHIRGKYVLILDSDDTLTYTAVERVRQEWQIWHNNESVGMLTFLRGKSEADPLSIGPVAGKPVDILRHKRKNIHSSDCCEVVREELIRRYPFPVFEGERFMGEGVLWNRIAQNYKCVYVNEVIYICDYLENGLTRSGRSMRIRNPRGGMLSAEISMQKKNYWHLRIKNGLLYTCYGCFAGLAPSAILTGTEHKGIVALCMLPGYLLYRYWKKKYM